MALTSERRYLTLKEAADYMQVSYGTMWKYTKQKSGPPVCRYDKGRLKIPYQRFLKWVESNTSGAPNV